MLWRRWYCMDIRYFGSVDDREISLFTLKNDRIKAEILNYGGAIRSLVVDGVDVVCGFDEIDGYFFDNAYHGALIGRYANRIADGFFSLNGKEYVLQRNERGVTHLHGGRNGFDKRVWDAVPSVGEDGIQSLELSMYSNDGEEGYPGNLTVTVTYTLTQNGLLIHYYAVGDMDTPLNLTNHSYFNLNGYDGGDIFSHMLKINADFYSPVDNNLIPVNIDKVDGSPFNFKNAKPIGKDIFSPHPQLITCGGYDHNFFINKKSENRMLLGDKTLYEAAELSCDDRSISVYTDMPCIQLYTGNYMDGVKPFKNGVKQEKYHALCLETQYMPNSPNNGEAILKAGEIYDKTTAYIFD